MRIKRAWFRALLRRRIAVSTLLILQVLFIGCMIGYEQPVTKYIQTCLHVVSIIIVLHVISQKDKGANKATWVFLILLFPLFGSVFYILYYFQSSTVRFRKEISKIKCESSSLYQLPGDAWDVSRDTIPQHLPQIRYLQQFAGFPIFDATDIHYFSPGEQLWSHSWRN